MMKIFTLLLLILTYLPLCQSATFCATTSAELQSALDAANTNNQHNVIRIAEGNYITPGTQFSYNGNGTNTDWNLEISGGWRPFLTSLCGTRNGSTPFDTVLDGNSNNRVLHINAYGNADITISNLLFINGVVGDSFRGGGLEIFTLNLNNGNLVLERTGFINNEADFGSAFSITGFNKMTIRNNLIGANNAIAGIAVSILQNDKYGVYFTNNTVINNTKDNVNGFGAGVHISVSGNSNAAVYNNLIWNNEIHDLHLGGNTFLINNDIGARDTNSGTVNPFSDSGNFSAPPDFAGLTFVPSINSPLVDAGIKPFSILPMPTPFELAWGLGVTDFIGNDRLQGTNVDIGAFESTPNTIFNDGFE